MRLMRSLCRYSKLPARAAASTLPRSPLFVLPALLLFFGASSGTKTNQPPQQLQLQDANVDHTTPASSTDRDYSLRVEEYRDFTRPGFPTVSDAPLVLSPVQEHTRNEHDRHPPNDDTFSTDLYLFRYRFFGPADFLGQWLDIVIKWESHHLGSDFLKLTTDCNVAGVVMRLFATQKTMIEKFVAEEYDRRRRDGIGRSPPTSEDPELTDEDVMLATVLREAQEIAVRYADYGTEPGEDQLVGEVAV